MAPKKGTNWVEIQRRYLLGESPKDIAKDFGLTAKQVSKKAYDEEWTSKKEKIREKVADKIQAQFEQDMSHVGEAFRMMIQNVLTEMQAGRMGATIQDGEGLPNAYHVKAWDKGLGKYLEMIQADKPTEASKSPDEMDGAASVEDIKNLLGE